MARHVKATMLLGIHRNVNRGQGAVMLVAALSVIVMSGCGSQADDRRFAGEEVDTVAPASSSVTASAQATAVLSASPVGSPAPVADLAIGHGGGEEAAVQAGTAVFAVNSVSGDRTRLFEASDGRILATSLSPDGQVVALLVRTGFKPASPLQLLVLDLEGVELLAVDNLGGTADGSPAAATTTGGGGVSWRGASQTVTVALPQGGLVEVGLDGAIESMLPASRAKAPSAVSWSDDGQAIAYVDRAAGGGDGLAVASAAALPLDPVWLLRPSSSLRTILGVDWVNGRDSLLYLTRSAAAGVPGGDLLIQAVNDTSPGLFASAAEFSPVAAITTFAVSPDEEVVAYVVEWPGGNADQPAIVVLRQTGSDFQRRISLQRGVIISGLAWTDAGLIVAGSRQLPDGKREPVFYLAGANGGIGLLSDPLLATPEPSGAATTPPASPASSPEPLS